MENVQCFPFLSINCPVDSHDSPGAYAQIPMLTTIYLDCWKAYSLLNSEGFSHLTVNHSVNFETQRQVLIPILFEVGVM